MIVLPVAGHELKFVRRCLGNGQILSRHADVGVHTLRLDNNPIQLLYADYMIIFTVLRRR